MFIISDISPEKKNHTQCKKQNFSTSPSLLSSCSKQTRGKESEMVLHHLIFLPNKWREQWSGTHKKKAIFITLLLSHEKQPPSSHSLVRNTTLIEDLVHKKNNVQSSTHWESHPFLEQNPVCVNIMGKEIHGTRLHRQLISNDAHSVFM